MEKAPHSGEVRMSFMEHLVELRQRLVKSVIAVCIGFGAAYTFAERLFGFLTIPYNQAYREVFHREAKLVNTGLIEPFLVYLKVGMMAGVFLASPFIFYQLWQFVAPGLRPQERKHVVPFVLLASLFFIGGALFGYFGVFPIGFKYFLSVAPAGYVDPLIRMDEYYRLAAWMMVVFGLVFEGPLIVLYLVYFGIIQTHHLVRNWRGIIVGIAVASALLTPADPGSMIMMAIPLTILYGITILLSLFLSRRSTSAAKG